MSRRVVLACLLALVMLLTACAGGKVNPNQSKLLDNAHAYFLGEPEMRETPGLAETWDADHVLIFLYARGSAEKGKAKDGVVPSQLWCVNSSGKVDWKKDFGAVRPSGFARLDSNTMFVLLSPAKSTGNESAVLRRIDRSGNTLLEHTLNLPDDWVAARACPITEDHILIMAWQRMEGGTLDASKCRDIHVNAKGDTLPLRWGLVADMVRRLDNGDVLGVLNSFDQNPVARQITRVRPDGTVAWKIDTPLDTVKAKIYGVTQNAKGEILVSAFSEGDSDEGGYKAYIAKYSADGKRLWIKSPAEMDTYRIYGLAPFGDGRYLVPGHKMLKNSGLSTKMWDALAAFVVDENGKVVDQDIVSDKWTMAVGGAQAMSPRRDVIIGIGGNDTKGDIKKSDIAVYILDVPAR